VPIMNPNQHAQLVKLHKLRDALVELKKINRETLGSLEQDKYAPPVKDKAPKDTGTTSNKPVSDTITGLHNRKNRRNSISGDTSGDGKNFTGGGGVGGNVGAYRT